MNAFTTYPRAWCEQCGRRELLREMVAVQTAKQTHSSPAEYEGWCARCVEQAGEVAEYADEMRSLGGLLDEELERI